MGEAITRKPAVLYLAGLMSLCSGMALSQAEDINIAIGSDTMQTFKGIGFNLTQYQPWVDNLAVGQQETYVKDLVTKWGFNSAVLWGDKWGTECCGENDPRNAVDTTEFEIRENVLQTVKWLREAGMEHLLMNPTRDRYEADHVDLWTNCAWMWRNKGVEITAMSFLNKPNTRFPGQRNHPQGTGFDRIRDKGPQGRAGSQRL